jgi:hypothetical protein
MTDYVQRFEALRQRNGERDKRMRDVAMIRAGHTEQVFPGLFPEGAWSKPIIANMIDVVAKDLSEQVGVLPTITATGDSTLDEGARTKADKRTKIANYYVAASKLGTQLIRAADQFITYGFVPLRVEPHFKDSRPHIHVESCEGAYYDIDRFGDVISYAHLFRRKAGDLAAMFPEHADKIMGRRGMLSRGVDETSMVEVVRWYDKDRSVMFLPEREGLTLATTPNKIGYVPVVIAQRPTLDGEARGQFDDVLPVYAAKARLALLMMEATQKSVEAPLALPQDVTQLSIGPDSVIRSNTPERIRRVQLDLPSMSFAENNLLSEELRFGTRFPESRAGQADGSIVTGQGIKALQAAFDSQVKTAQSILGETLGEALSLALMVDEAYFGDVQREVSSTANGVQYKLKYRPSTDIAGNYGISTSFGLMAGLDPNRSLIFALQARGDKLISRNFTRRHLPLQMNVVEEERAIDMEEMRDSLKAGVASLAAAIPQMAANGQDPTKIIEQMSTIITERKKGTPLEEAVEKAFAAEEPESVIDPVTGQEVPSAVESAVEQGGAQNEVMPSPPPMQRLLAGLTGTGRPVMSGSVSRQIPA